MPLQIKGHFDWRQAARGQAIPTSELQRVDDMAMQGFDESGGFAGDNIANPANTGELTPGTLQCIWVKITNLNDALDPPAYSGDEVTGSYDGAIPLPGVYSLRHHESSIVLIDNLYEVNNVFDDLLIGKVVLTWPSNDVTPSGVTIWRFVAPGGSGVAAFKRGKLDGTMAFGGSATMSVWEWNGTTDADTGENVTVWDWLLSTGQTIASGKNVVANYDAASGRWFVTGASCP